MNLISVPQKETFCWLLLKTILAMVTWSFECGKKQSTPKRDCSALLCGGSSVLVPVFSVAADPALEPPYNESRWEQPSPRTRFLLPAMSPRVVSLDRFLLWATVHLHRLRSWQNWRGKSSREEGRENHIPGAEMELCRIQTGRTHAKLKWLICSLALLH